MSRQKVTGDEPSSDAQDLMEYLGCPCTYFPSMSDDKPILEAYYEAKASAQAEGYVPMLIVVDKTLLECLQLNVHPNSSGALDFDYQAVDAYRKEHLAHTDFDGCAVLEKMINTAKEYAQDDDLDWEEDVIGEIQDGYKNESFIGYMELDGKQTQELILAKIPVKYPWQIFAYLPFGNWNECPDTPELMAVAKHWYEKYGAVPVVMTHDVLEFEVPKAVNNSDAIDLAIEQYAFCNDIVDQGVESVGCLVDTLCRSKIWYFWWD